MGGRDGEVSRASACGGRDAVGGGGMAGRRLGDARRDRGGGGMEEAGSGWKMRWARAGGRGDAPDAAVGRAASRGAGGRAERADADGTGERDREGHGARRVAVRWRVPGNVYRAEIFRPDNSDGSRRAAQRPDPGSNLDAACRSRGPGWSLATARVINRRASIPRARHVYRRASRVPSRRRRRVARACPPRGSCFPARCRPDD